MTKTEIPHANSFSLKEVNAETMADFRCEVVKNIRNLASKGFPSLTLKVHNSVIFSADMLSSASKVNYNFEGQVFSEEEYVNFLVEELEERGYQITRHEPCRIEISWLNEANESSD
ncbi:hypothetical protein HWD03_gp049 [Alteromonas phage vB_AmeM_PT11-V22]|uniref:Uncharacterized protein n=1 Tax=Alteromonas phage vB_AmeM_PT11-V22 TaxID=2704031 RepID=A0A6C0R0Q2_9CAUD|nr:hypothetical protein HWD03_gp049 [Alteromonas phage vB_AmeM_PT11-V22]QHZ59809.1 hypothetical protein [Alteromonas phage vB_AmeM_PT11-V22]